MIKAFFNKLTQKEGKNTNFADFLRTAPLRKQLEVFEKAAYKANEDQRRIVAMADSQSNIQ